MTCTHQGCPDPVYARRLCQRHYQRARATGSLPPSAATERPCEQCGQLMAARKSNRAKYCSVECKEIARNAALQQARVSFKVDRRCDECGEPIPVTMSGKARFCSIKCNSAWHNRRKVEAKRSANLAKRGPCRGCGEPIPTDRRSDAVYCSRRCMALDVRARNYDTDRARDYNRSYLYGVTTEQFDVLLTAQGGRCAICCSDAWPGKDNRPNIDHNHTTGAVRGILCGNCNQGLGRFNDDPALLRAAADYVEGFAREAHSSGVEGAAQALHVRQPLHELPLLLVNER